MVRGSSASSVPGVGGRGFANRPEEGIRVVREDLVEAFAVGLWWSADAPTSLLLFPAVVLEAVLDRSMDAFLVRPLGGVGHIFKRLVAFVVEVHVADEGVGRHFLLRRLPFAPRLNQCPTGFGELRFVKTS